MKIRTILAETALVAGLGLTSPVLAQSANGPGDDVAGDNQIDDGSFNNQNEDGTQLYLNNLLNDFADNSFNSDNDGNNDGNVIDSDLVTATQLLVAVNANSSMEEVIDLNDDGHDFDTGDNSVAGGAFASYAGILNQAWNTGVNANTQAASNIAAQGTVNFGGSASVSTDNGGDNGGDT